SGNWVGSGSTVACGARSATAKDGMRSSRRICPGNRNTAGTGSRRRTPAVAWEVRRMRIDPAPRREKETWAGAARTARPVAFPLRKGDANERYRNHTDPLTAPARSARPVHPPGRDALRRQPGTRHHHGRVTVHGPGVTAG